MHWLFGCQWVVGDRCRAVYSEDGEIYEAVILSVDPENEVCYVRYVDYGNEEEQYIPNIMPPLKEKSKQRQQRVAELVDSDTYTEVRQSDSIMNTSLCPDV